VKCNKIPLNLVLAKYRLDMINLKGKNKRCERRIYYCNKCKAYHLTSKTKEEYKSSKDLFVSQKKKELVQIKKGDYVIFIDEKCFEFEAQILQVRSEGDFKFPNVRLCYVDLEGNRKIKKHVPVSLGNISKPYSYKVHNKLC